MEASPFLLALVGYTMLLSRCSRTDLPLLACLVLCMAWSCSLAQTLSLTPFSSLLQDNYIKASNTDGNDQFGSVLALSGNTLVVGAPFEDSNATGVNGDEDNNGSNGAGAAYVYVRHNDSWMQQAYLKASNTDRNDHFGTAVAIDGDTIVITAPDEDSSATGVNGDESNNSSGSAGAAYVFKREMGEWFQVAYLKASNTDSGDGFGSSVDIWGDTIVIGSESESSSATGVDGDEADNSANNAGAAYVFQRPDDVWQQTAYSEGIKYRRTGQVRICSFSLEQQDTRGCEAGKQ